ncbi:UDP-N-acetylglucosamine 1-carboxyvinyltransferase [bacterium (Candidatus Howlettbacteria) CG_4_10_14_0_8_um_filter_40_9]|nr:MAG: UDP-N-acetylglucosamine 1-carboxyvinyltransferase [bacterium (Candidatus Howlettbacteria) CG_4_10_14_0_8_um_filter_40_9]
MQSFIIKGPTKLEGEISASGSKNAALPIIAASILASGITTLKNIPDIVDIQNLLKILEGLGAKTNFENNVLTIDTKDIKSYIPDKKLVKNLRASVLLMGSILARFGKVEIPTPGGCFIGPRPIDVHLAGFEALGATITQEKDMYFLEASKLTGNKFTFGKISVTATENILQTAVLSEGESELRLTAIEPHVTDFCNFLVKMGAKIDGIGTHFLKVKGVKELHSVEHEIIPDQIEAGTFAIAGAVGKGELIVNNFIAEHHDMLLNKFSEMGVNFTLGKNNITLKQNRALKPINIQTEVYPGLPTDLQAPFSILLTQAEGTSNIFETIFEGRLNYLHELNKMGASAIVSNPHQARIIGPTPLHGTHISGLDLRAGATLIIASIIAEGTSEINGAEVIDRGYEDIVGKLTNIGANIERKEEEY